MLIKLVNVWIWCNESNLDGILRTKKEETNDKGQRAKEARNKYPDLSQQQQAPCHIIFQPPPTRITTIRIIFTPPAAVSFE